MSAGPSERGVILLVGPRGVGKRTLGKALSERGLGRFIDVRAVTMRVWKRHGLGVSEAYSADVVAAIDAALDEALSSDAPLIFETTGAGPGSARWVDRIRRARSVFSVRLRASRAVCAERLRDDVPTDDAFLSMLYAGTQGFDATFGRAYDLDLHLDKFDPPFPAVDRLADGIQAALAQSWFGGRTPTWTGQLVLGDGIRTVRLWESTDVEVAPAEFHGYLFVEGNADLDPPRPCPGGTPFQATHLTWARLRKVELDLDGLVTEMWPPSRTTQER